jgi:hypothetical protein
MLQEIELPDVTDNFDDSHVTNTFCQVNDNDFDDVLIVETDCINFGSRALHHKDVPVSDHHNAYNSTMPRAKELVSISDLQLGLLRQLPLPLYSNNYLVNNF